MPRPTTLQEWKDRIVSGEEVVYRDKPLAGQTRMKLVPFIDEFAIKPIDGIFKMLYGNTEAKFELTGSFFFITNSGILQVNVNDTWAKTNERYFCEMEFVKDHPDNRASYANKKIKASHG